MNLSTLAQGRDNNFNLIRIVAAMAVLVTHSFALAIGSPDAEPLRRTLGITIGTIAVDVFFTASGLLVTASLLRSRSIIDFFWARFLRIFPALLVMLVLVVFGLGLAFTTYARWQYITTPQTWTYFARCGTLLTGVVYQLPGIFQGNPYPRAVNGSLWTMPYETRLYAVVALTWLIAAAARSYRPKTFKIITVSFAIVAGAMIMIRHVYGTEDIPSLRLPFMFFTGASAFIFRQHVVFKRWAVLLLAGSLCLLSFMSAKAFNVVYELSVAYLLFYLAYVPGGMIRKYNRLGDYSYGLYIYAFPVQQSIAALIPGVSVAALLSLSAAGTLAIAVLSWHLIEKRALGAKGHCVTRTRDLLAPLITRRWRTKQ